MARVLREDPGLYHRLRGRRTARGHGLADCVQVGMDCPGRGGAGVMACDAECYAVFREVFDPIITETCGPPGAHRPASTPPTLEPMDPDRRYVLRCTAQTRRSVLSAALPPRISFEERRGVEAMVVRALLQGARRAL
eukprot:TRINITY_DN21951_c0_g1_i1.p2 TRINITY_DN21951_c0_g1~~TRINITY_DN21951_c0_g1_i1.p2  ORF type:complete len:137 (-),score=26.32 TRINITY_DN21951_c0_g1_i1:170-580(-)